MRVRAVAVFVAVSSMGVTARRAHAQGPSVPAVDPAVETVVSGGVWSAGATHGRYRVLVIAEGWEEIRRHAMLHLSFRAAERPLGSYSRRVTFELGPPGTVRRISEP